MMTRRSLMGFAAAAGGTLALGGCEKEKIDRVVHYRWALDIETPDGQKSGSGVIELHYHDQSGLGSFDSAIPWSVRARGEAVVVDLDARGVLFVLLKGDPMRSVSISAPRFVVPTLFETWFVPDFHEGEKGAEQLDRIVRAKPKIDVLPDRLPMLVRFGDIADPKSVARVDPNNLAASFGPGVKLVRATIEITDDTVTTGIEKKLGWLPQVGKERGTLIPNPPRLLKDASVEQRITPGAFTTFDIWIK